MPLQDVSHDSSMIDWLRHAGHGHLLNTQQQQQQQQQYANLSTSASLPVISGGHNNENHYQNSYNRSTAYSQTANFNDDSYDHQVTSRGFNSSSPSPPIIREGQSRVDPYHGSYNRPGFYSPTANFNNLSYGSSGGGYQQNFTSTPTQFHAPHMDQYRTDADIEHMKHDPNTRVIQRPAQDDVVYKQRVFVKYLQPPTPPVSGAIIVREKQLPQPPPDPPVVIRRVPPPPPTPPPIVIRERPPPIPQPEGTTIINKIIPSLPKPPRQVFIEQFPQLPPKPQDVILEKWLPVPPRQRRIFYERLPAPHPTYPTSTQPVIIQHGQPRVHVQRQVISAPGPCVSGPCAPGSCQSTLCPPVPCVSTSCPPVPCAPCQPICSSECCSSLISYSPNTALEPCYSTLCPPQGNVVITQNSFPNTISSSSYGMPLTCVCARNPAVGLGAYGSCISTVPTVGYSPGQSAVYSVPGNVPVDSILRQFGIDPCCLQRSPGITCPSRNIVTYVTHPHGALAHVWNAASHMNPFDSSSYLAASNAIPSSTEHTWNYSEQYPHLQSGVNQSLFNHIPC